MNGTKISLGKKVLIGGFVIVIILLLTGLYYPLATFNDSHVNGNSGISARPGAAQYNFGKLDSLPVYDPDSSRDWQVDIRSRGLTSLNLGNRLDDLMYADFDSKTKWPESLPDSFNPESIMEYNKNPGFNLKQLHQQGITGKCVSIAIIDSELLTEHEEYKDRLIFYERIHAIDEGGGRAGMHGVAVSSIAVGENTGVTPESSLYYIAATPSNSTIANILGKSRWDFKYMAKAIDRILEVNKTLSPDKKIRVISISVGWTPKQKGFKQVDEAVKRAQKEGVLVVSTVMPRYYDVNLLGLGRDPLNDADSLDSYRPGLYWQKDYFSNNTEFTEKTDKTIMVPMDSRSTASPTGTNDYVFYRIGGLSWSVPYWAGLYALCCQVQPNITPEQFLAAAIATGDVNDFENNGEKYRLGTVANPVRLLDKLQSKAE